MSQFGKDAGNAPGIGTFLAVRIGRETTVVGWVSRPVSIPNGSGDPSYKCDGYVSNGAK